MRGAAKGLRKRLYIGLAALLFLVQGLTLIQPQLAHAAVGVPEILKDIKPTDGTVVNRYTQLGDKIIFDALDGPHGGELWTTDGTTAGTQLLKDINPGSGNSQPSQPIVLGDKAYFYAEDVPGDRDLWVTDGTTIGTQKLYNFSTTGGAVIDFCGVMGGQLYFVADDGTHGQELWQTDGTTLGTAMVVDLKPGSAGSQTSTCTVDGSELFFNASPSDLAHAGIWKSDGTELGTELVKGSIGFAGTISADHNHFLVFKGEVYFKYFDGAHTQIWKTDGTVGGTVSITNFSSPGIGSLEKGVVAGTYIYVDADDGTHGKELWKSDGTLAGTSMVKDINPGIGGSFIDQMVPVYNDVYFVAFDGSVGNGIWVSNGTEAGTRRLTQASDGNVNSGGDFVVYGDTVYFRGHTSAAGDELWQTHGTAASTSMVADIAPGSAPGIPDRMAIFGQTMYFTARDADGYSKLFKMDLPPAVTTDLNSDGEPDGLQPNIAGFTDPVSGKTAVIDAGPGCEITSYESVSESSLTAADAGYSYPYGLFNFAGSCGSAGFTTTVHLYIYDADKDGFTLRKFHSHTKTYATVPGASLTQRTIDGHSVIVASYDLKDGGSLDADGASNGVFTDPAGFAKSTGAPNTGFDQQSSLPVVMLLVGGGLVSAAAMRRAYLNG